MKWFVYIYTRYRIVSIYGNEKLFQIFAKILQFKERNWISKTVYSELLSTLFPVLISQTSHKIFDLHSGSNLRGVSVHISLRENIIYKMRDETSFLRIYTLQGCEGNIILILYITSVKSTLMQIWKFPYMFVLYPENFAFLILRILELFASEVWKFLKK